MQKFDLDADELNVILISLIRRRDTAINMLEMSMIPEHKESYDKEIKTVDKLLEKFFPGSVERIKKYMNQPA